MAEMRVTAEQRELPGRKVLRVHPIFGKYKEPFWERLIFQKGKTSKQLEVEEDRQFIKVFKQAGFSVVRGGNFNETNSQEVGFQLDRTPVAPHGYERARSNEIATKAQVEMPLHFH